jgi:hypothetical protein
MQDETPEEREQADLAAREAASIGGEGRPEQEPEAAGDEAMRAVAEAGGGEAEGFELAEEMLIERASHGDQQSAHAVLHDAMLDGPELPDHADGEADRARSSEREDEEPPAES